MLIIDWDKFDEKYNWAAQDADGAIWLFPRRPKLNPIFKQWEIQEGQEGDEPLCIQEATPTPPGDEWVNSLTWKQRSLTSNF